MNDETVSHFFSNVVRTSQFHLIQQQKPIFIQCLTSLLSIYTEMIRQKLWRRKWLRSDLTIANDVCLCKKVSFAVRNTTRDILNDLRHKNKQKINVVSLHLRCVRVYAIYTDTITRLFVYISFFFFHSLCHTTSWVWNFFRSVVIFSSISVAFRRDIFRKMP